MCVCVANVRADRVQVLPVVHVLGIVGHVLPQLKQTLWETFKHQVTLTGTDQHRLQHRDCRGEDEEPGGRGAGKEEKEEGKRAMTDNGEKRGIVGGEEGREKGDI